MPIFSDTRGFMDDLYSGGTDSFEKFTVDFCSLSANGVKNSFSHGPRNFTHRWCWGRGENVRGNFLHSNSGGVSKAVFGFRPDLFAPVICAFCKRPLSNKNPSVPNPDLPCPGGVLSAAFLCFSGALLADWICGGLDLQNWGAPFLPPI